MISSPATGKKLVLPRRRIWTCEEYERAAELGLFRPEERLELIAGDIVATVPHTPPHAAGICLSKNVLNRIFTEGYDVRSQLPLAIGNWSEPEPDIAVVTGSIRDYETQHPTTAVLVVEVADTTLRFDRTTKSALYAQAGIPEYWILALKNRTLIAYRNPAPMSVQPLGYSYQTVRTLAETETISPLAAPKAFLAVADLLPHSRS